MNTHTPPAAGYLDILFAHRNKQYGAYELRNNYNRRMIKAGAMAMLAVGVLALFTSLNRKSNDDTTLTGSKAPVVTDTTVVYTQRIEQVQKIEQPAGHTGRTAKTTDFAAPVIVQDPIADKPIAKMPDKDALAGPVDNPGLADGTAIAMDNTLSDGTAGDVLSRQGDPRDSAFVAAAPPVENKIREVAEEMPEFPGGIKAWQKYLSDHLRYPQLARSEDIQGTVYVNFIVSKDGSISNINIVKGLGGGCSEEAMRVLAAAPRWKAGRQNGHAVNVKMTLPIRFALR